MGRQEKGVKKLYENILSICETNSKKYFVVRRLYVEVGVRTVEMPKMYESLKICKFKIFEGYKRGGVLRSYRSCWII